MKITKGKVDISVVIPVYNTSDSLVELEKRISNIFSSLPYKYEIIFVDDASSNKETWKTLTALSRREGVKCLTLMRNFGQQAATLCGLAEAGGDYIITMDDDLQHLPEDIPKLIAEKEHDIVIAQLKKRKHKLLRVVASKIKGWFDYIILGKPKNIVLSSFRMLKKKVVEGILQIQTPNPFVPAMMLYVSKDIKGIWVDHGERKEGKSGYNLYKMLKLFSNLLINNSSILLRAIAVFGIFVSFFSILIGCFFIYKKIALGVTVTGWTSLMLAITFSSGLLFFVVGIIGQFLIRIVSGIEKKPTYIIREKIGE